MEVIYFLDVSARKNICLHPETVPRNTPLFCDEVGLLRTEKYLE